MQPGQSYISHLLQTDQGISLRSFLMLTLHHRHYERTKTDVLRNTPYVDNSYKWSGGGFMSTMEDLVKFGNVMSITKIKTKCV